MGFPEDFRSYPMRGKDTSKLGIGLFIGCGAIAKEILSQSLLSNEPNEPPRHPESRLLGEVETLANTIT